MSELFDIRLESDLSEFDSTVTDSGDLSWSATGLSGSSGKMNALIDDTTVIYGQANFTATGALRARFYFDYNSLTQVNSGDFFAPLMVYNSANALCAIVYIAGDGDNCAVALYTYNDSASFAAKASVTGITDAEHYVEIHLTAGAGDGIAKLWVDGSYIGGVTDMDTDTRWASMTYARLGAQAITDTTGTILLDEFKANNDGGEIGARIQVVTPVGIASTLAFGTIGTTKTHAITGTASSLAFGTVSTLKSLSVSGIASALAIGTVAIRKIVSVSGIASGTAFGSVSFVKTVLVSGIGSTLVMGAVTILGQTAGRIRERIFPGRRWRRI